MNDAPFQARISHSPSEALLLSARWGCPSLHCTNRIPNYHDVKLLKNFFKRTIFFPILTVERDSLRASSTLDCQLLLFAFISAGLADNVSEGRGD